MSSVWQDGRIAVTDLDPALSVGDGDLLERANRGTALIVIAAKPQHVVSVIEGLRDVIRAEDLVVSIAAGTGLETIETALCRQRSSLRLRIYWSAHQRRHSTGS